MNDDVLKTLGLFGPKGFNRAAALLADKNPYPGIDIVRFGPSVSAMLDRATVGHVSMPSQLGMAMEMYRRHLSIKGVEGMTRTVRELVPREAFREAVANALVHRAWGVDSRVRVSIFTIASRSLPRAACRPASPRQTIRPLNALVDRGPVVSHGEGGGRRYSRA